MVGEEGDGQPVYQGCLRGAFVDSGLGNTGDPKWGVGLLLTASQF